jgi:FkbM family methyltransferase
MKLINGNHLELDLSDPRVSAHFKNPNNYTKEILEEWDSEPFKKFVTPDCKTILDCGANVGLFALHVLPYAEKIVCVEPTPAHMEVQKVLLNGKVIHEQSALNSYTGKCGWHIEPVNYTMNTIRDQTGMEVDCITLHDLCIKHDLKKVDFCKIDIEGSEVLALTEQTVKPVFEIIDRFLIELHPRTREMQDRFKSIFEASGYKVEYYDFKG